MISQGQLDTAFPFQQDDLADGIIVVGDDDPETALKFQDVIENGIPHQALLLQTPDEVARCMD